MPLALVIVLGLIVAVIYLLRIVTALRDRVDSLEHNVYKLSQNPRDVAPEPPPTAQAVLAVAMDESSTETSSIGRAPSGPVEVLAASRRRGDSTPKQPSPSPSIAAPPVLAPLGASTNTTASPPPPSPPLRSPAPKPTEINWEQFLGAKLFAWIGGLALFVGIAFFVKYSFDRDLIPPWLRVVLGFAVGLGLVAGGVMTRRKEYLITAQTLVATGVVVLYSVSFFARSLYHLINTPFLLVLMSGVTVAAFTLAIRMDARVVAVLGMLGGFLTPQLAPVTKDLPLVLFGYVLVLNIGLLVTARKCNWRFLIPLAASATVLTETLWVMTSLRVASVPATLWMIGAITALFVANAWFNPDRADEQPRSLFAGTLQGLLVFGVAWVLMVDRGFDVRPATFLSTLFLGNVALLLLYARTLNPLPLIMAVSGAGALLAMWIRTGPDLVTACLATLVYGGLNALLPAWLPRVRETSRMWPNAASVGCLVLLLLVLFGNTTPGWFFWAAALAINGILLAVAFLRGSLWLALCGSLGTALLSVYWIFHMEANQPVVQPLGVIAIFAVIYFFLGGLLSRKLSQTEAAYFPAIPAGVPFVLMALLMARLEIDNPSLLFAFAAGLNALLIFASPSKSTTFSLVALAGTFLLEFLWFGTRLAVFNAPVALAWYAGFSLAFTFLPLLRKQTGDWLPWYVSAVAGPIHFFLIYGAAKLLWPNMSLPGVVPVVLGLPAAIMLLATRASAPDKESFLRFTAIYGASLLFFVTLIFPIQFDRQWLTMGWALEGVALLWLNRRAPAQWLVGLGSVLLIIAFMRLGFNLSVFQYQQRGAIPIFNWYLYAYGIVAVALFAAARLGPRVQNGTQLKAIFNAMGTWLLFLLMNIQIADIFAEGPYLTFDFSGNFARDMTYSIAWSLFALTLLMIGVKQDVPAVRYAGLALMGATLLKLFFHDLTRLDALFRIGAFVGVAIILIFASWIYQKFLSGPRNSSEIPPPA